MREQIVYKCPSLIGLLGVVFVILKLTNVINWSWWWVTLPFWGPIVFFTIVLIAVLTIVGLVVIARYKDEDIY